MLSVVRSLLSPKTLTILFPFHYSPKTLTTRFRNPSDFQKHDEYFAAINHISNIVRTDIYMERTLNKLRLTINSELVFRVLRACSRSPIESYRFFNWARTSNPYTPTTHEFDQLLRTLAQARHWKTMWSLAHQMCSLKIPISPSTVSFIIVSYGDASLLDQAVLLFNKSPKSLNCPHTTEVYNALLSALCSSNNFQAAYALVRRMVRKSIPPDKATYSTLVNSWCSAGKTNEAQAFLQEMSQKGYAPPVRGRDLLIEGLLNAGHVQSAKDMVRRMTKEGHLPDIATFNALLEAVSKLGEVDFVIEVYFSACKAGLCADIETYKVLIPAASRARKVEVALGLIHAAIEDGHKPFPSLYAPIVKALCKLGQFDDAACLFSDMKVKGHPPNRPVYTMLITLCGRSGRYVQAAAYLTEMVDANLIPLSRCFDMVSDGLKKIGKHDLAERIQQLEISLRPP